MGRLEPFEVGECFNGDPRRRRDRIAGLRLDHDSDSARVREDDLGDGICRAGSVRCGRLTNARDGDVDTRCELTALVEGALDGLKGDRNLDVDEPVRVARDCAVLTSDAVESPIHSDAGDWMPRAVDDSRSVGEVRRHGDFDWRLDWAGDPLHLTDEPLHADERVLPSDERAWVGVGRYGGATAGIGDDLVAEGIEDGLELGLLQRPIPSRGARSLGWQEISHARTGDGLPVRPVDHDDGESGRVAAASSGRAVARLDEVRESAADPVAPHGERS